MGSKAGPGVGGQYKVDFMVFCVLYFCFDSQGFFLFCLQRRMIMKLQGRKLGEGKQYDQNMLYEKNSIKEVNIILNSIRLVSLGVKIRIQASQGKVRGQSAP